MRKIFINTVFILFCMQMMGQNVIVEIESPTQGMLMPKMASDPTTDLKEGMLYYNTTINHLKFYNGIVWDTINANGRDGIDGSPGAMGPQGPEGELEWFGLACWDTNLNGIGDLAEDLNNDGFFTRADCINGSGGDVGDVGLPALPAIVTAQPLGTDNCVVFDEPILNNNSNLVILHTYRRTTVDSYAPPLMNLNYDAFLGQWKVCSNNGLPINSSVTDTKSFIDLLIVSELP